MKKSFFGVLLLILLGLLVRAFLSPLFVKGDLLVFKEWSVSLYDEGLAGSYFREGWIYSVPTQPPLMMLMLWISRWLYEHLYLLAQAHNIFRVPPGFVLLWLKENGMIFFLRCWSFVAEVGGGALSYLIIKEITRREKYAFFGLAFFLFNPVTLFDGSIWGQPDLLSPLLVILSFLVFRKSYGQFLSPIFFSLGLLIKPTVAIFIPFYFVFVLRDTLSSETRNIKKSLATLFLGSVISLMLALLIFLPFYDRSTNFFSFMVNVISTRILPSAKGITHASNSAFNLYTLFFTIDETSGDYQLVLFSLTQIGNIIVAMIMTGLFRFWWRNQTRIVWPNALIVFLLVIGESWFLFKTGMLERYFFVVFLPTTIMLFMGAREIVLPLLVQNIVWFGNLFYSFFQRDYSSVKYLFEGHNYLLIRALSLINLVVFIYIVLFLRRSVNNKL
ncbi:hypothetical protein FJZ40_01705 [Candidatus Shapirobacteria bacterium]|nr:hypothetical protein [Candidatus Shapirobacteria bacterium]